MPVTPETAAGVAAASMPVTAQAGLTIALATAAGAVAAPVTTGVVVVGVIGAGFAVVLSPLATLVCM